MPSIFIDPSYMSGTAKPAQLPRIVPHGRMEKECFIAKAFAEIQPIAGVNILDITPHVNDNGNAVDHCGGHDVIAKTNIGEIGIQLTELKIAHKPASADRAQRIVEKLMNKVLEYEQPQSRIWIDIHSTQDGNNQLVKLDDNQIDKLANSIARSISDDRYSPHISEMFGKKGDRPTCEYNDVPDALKNIIARVRISRIPDNHNVMCYRNLYIKFHFTLVLMSNELISMLIESIYEKKKNSKSGTLLVWSCDIEMTSYEECIISLLKKYGAKSQFRNIYYFSSMDAEGLFEANKKVHVIKEEQPG